MLPLYPELYLLVGYGFLRLTVIAIYTSIQQGKEMGLQDLDIPEPMIGKIFYFFFILLFGAILVISITCIILLLIGFNFFFYMLIELFLSVANTGGMEANFTFLTMYDSLEPKEQYYVWGMFFIALYRYLPKMIQFFRDREFLNQKNSWAWLVMGAPPVPKKNQFQKMAKALQNLIYGEDNTNKSWDLGSVFGSAYFQFLFFYFGAIIIMIKLPLAGPIIVLFLKAFFELYIVRLYQKDPATERRGKT